MKLLIASLLVLSPAIAAAQPAPAITATAARPEKDDTLNISPLGLVFGDLALTYEHLFPGGHGLVAEAGFGFSNGDDTSESHGAAGVGYRWHWRGRQNSGFLGVMVHQAFGSGEVSTDEMTYGATLKMTSVTGNIGKRWTLGDAWNITLRLGAGWGHYSVEIDDPSADAQDAEDILNAALAFLPVAVDGELSVGYAF